MLAAAARRKGLARDILDRRSDPVSEGKGRMIRQLLFKMGVLFNPRKCINYPYILTER